MSKSIIEKTKQWQSTIESYDDAISDAAEAILEVLEAKKQEEDWKIDDLELEFQKNCHRLEELNRKIGEEQKDLTIEISNLDRSALKNQLLNLILTQPDFAGLDKKAIEVANSIDNSDLDLQPVMFVHQIYIEHAKLVASKIIKILEKQN